MLAAPSSIYANAYRDSANNRAETYTKFSKAAAKERPEQLILVTLAKIAMGSGGLLGKGYGLGSQSQLEFLPERHTDFIFAAFAEEFGFVGAFFLLGAYAAIILVSLRIASLSHSHFGRLAASGVIATFAMYVLINGAMVMGLAPVVGVPMPLLSNGGTVMLTVMIGFGLVMATRVHRYAELPKGHGLI